jgi:hypothetical protein
VELDPAMIESSAEFSACGRYRYSLTRIWDRCRPMVAFIGLNPSTADALHDDPTVRRCVGFARRWRCGGVLIVNLFGYRATNPRELDRVSDPVGPDNDAAIAAAIGRADQIIAAWGRRGRYLDRDAAVLNLLDRADCLGRNRDGSPRHPLYLPAGIRPRRFHKSAHAPLRRLRVAAH